MDKLTKLTRDNLWTAVDDYRRHTYEPDVLDDISDNFNIDGDSATDLIDSASEVAAEAATESVADGATDSVGMILDFFG